MTRQPPRDRVRRLSVVALLTLHWALVVAASRHHSAAFDEVAHLGGGTMGLAASDHRFNPESGLLPQRWAALPLRATHVEIPGPAAEARREGDVWAVGRLVLFGLGNDADRLLLLGRAMIGLLSVGLGSLVYRVARDRSGPAGGLLALWLYTWSPTLLAHAGLVTADLCTALFLFAATVSLGRLSRRITAARTVGTGLLLGGAALSKASALVLGPVGLAIAGWRIAAGRPWTWSLGGRRGRLGSPRARAVAVVLTAACLGAVAFATVWTAYGWRFGAAGPEDSGGRFVHGWDEPPLLREGPAARAIAVARDHHLLPEAYLWGLAYTFGTTGSRDAFLAGETSERGWARFFPYAFLVKTPIPFLVLLVVAAFRRRRTPARERPVDAALAALFLVYGLVAVSSQLNIGHRHLLPLYPVLLVWAGGALSGPVRAPRARIAAAVCVLLAGLHAVESLRIRPHYLGYFNAFAGGPRNGWKHLVDSSLDWGQDLPSLARLLEQEPGNRWLGYFGSGWPGWYGIDARPLQSYFPLPMEEPPTPLGPGTYAVSATLLQGLHMGRPARWRPEDERAWKRVRREVEGPRDRTEPADRQRLLRDYQLLRSARLYAVLRTREPDAMAGYSILVYRLDAAGIRAALEGPVPGP